MAAARASGSRGGTSRASRSWRATSRQPRMSVRTSGRAMAAASMAERGMPSRQEASTNTSMTASRSSTSSRQPAKQTSVGGPGQLGLGDGVGLVQVGAAHDQEAHLRVPAAHRPGGGEQLPVALLGHQPAHRPHDQRAGGQPELGPERGHPVGVDPVGVEALEVGAVAEQLAPPGRDQPDAPGPAQVLLALVQLQVGAAGGQALEGEHGDPLGRPVLGGGVQAVDGVDDQRHPGQPGRDPPDHPRLGVVGVEQVEALAPQQPHQLGEGPQVGPEVPAPGGVAPGQVPDPGGLDGGRVGPGGADAGDLVALLAQPPQLAQEQVAQGQVGGGEVGHPDRRGGAHGRLQGPRPRRR